MICVNELTDLKCSKRGILSDLVVLIAPYAPHIAEELWNLLGHNFSVSIAVFPELNPEYLVENSFEYPVSFNGKTRFKMVLPMNLAVPEIEKAALAAPESEKWLLGKPPRKVIIVPGKIINIVI
jgi:leucyl-tRNA synthetase